MSKLSILYSARWRGLGQPGFRRGQLIRRAFAAAIVIFAVAISLSHRETTTTPVVIAASDIYGGAVIDEDDVRVVDFPADFAPTGHASEIETIVGRVAASTVASGTPISSANVVALDQSNPLVSNSTTSTSSEPFNMVPIRLADPGLAELLVHGDEVTIVTQSEEDSEGEPIATGGTVVFTSTKSSEKDSGTSPIPAGMVMIALPAPQAQLVAAASLGRPLAVVLTGTRANLTSTLN